MQKLLFGLEIELKKTRRRHLWLVFTALLAIITVWFLYDIDNEATSIFGWKMQLYNAPLLNAILIPTAIAVLASRLIDMEHRENMWKMLETMQSKFSIYISKLVYGFLGILIFSAAETALFLMLGFIFKYRGKPDLWAYGLFFIQTLFITFNLFMIQLIISIIFSNQAAALCVGLCGSMAGLFLMFIPQWGIIRCLLPWGNYGASMFVGMDYADKKIVGFYYMSQKNGAAFFIALWFAALSVGGWFIFKNMDTDGSHNYRYKCLISYNRTNEAQIRLPKLPTELIKIKRTPIWLAFIIVPSISAFIGTVNYLNNIEILQKAWHSLWTQHSLFFCYFFMPPLIGVYAGYLWRLEHSGANWNTVRALVSPNKLVLGKIAVCCAMTFFTLIWMTLLYALSGVISGLKEPFPKEFAGWFIFGALGGVAVCTVQCFLSLVIKNFAIPIGLSLAGGIVGLLATAKNLFYCTPYSLLSIGLRANNPDREIDTAAFMASFAVFVLLFYTLSVCYVKYSDVKTHE